MRDAPQDHGLLLSYALSDPIAIVAISKVKGTDPDHGRLHTASAWPGAAQHGLETVRPNHWSRSLQEPQ